MRSHQLTDKNRKLVIAAKVGIVLKQSSVEKPKKHNKQ